MQSATMAFTLVVAVVVMVCCVVVAQLPMLVMGVNVKVRHSCLTFGHEDCLQSVTNSAESYPSIQLLHSFDV
jgi:hypothetical protein